MAKTILILCLGVVIGIVGFHTVFETNPKSSQAQTVAANSKPKPSQQSLSRQDRLRTPPQYLNLVQQVNALKDELNSMKATLKEFAFRLDSINPSLANATPLTGKPQLSNNELSEIKDIEVKMQQVNEEHFNEQMMTIEDSFTNERRDTSWAKEQTERVMAALESLPSEILQGVDVKEAECRSSMCRIEADYSDEIAQNEFETQLPMLVGEDFPRLSVNHEQHEGFIKGIYFLQSEKM